MSPPLESPIGRRIAVIGTAASGKSALGERLAAVLDVPFVELDALYWKPDWVGTSDEEFIAHVRDATAGEGWVVAGNYHRVWPEYWHRVQTVIWLDLPLSLSVRRVIRRTWRRWRTRELLWGTNYERFWPQLKLWRPDQSLIAWAVTQRGPMRRRHIDAMADPRWSHIRFARLRSTREVERFVRELEGQVLDGRQRQSHA